MKWAMVFLYLVSLLVSSSLIAQQIVLQPDSNEGQDAVLFELDPDTNYGDHPDFISFYWTFFGTAGAGRSLLKFNLAKVPAQFNITRAYLSLYHNPTSTNQGQAGANASYLKKVISPWSENTVTWNTTPSTTFNGAIYLPESVSQTQDYTNIDITQFVKDWHANPSTNYGLMLALENNTLLSSMKFCSSDSEFPGKRPKLVIESGPQSDTCVVLQPDGNQGLDAFIFSIEPTTNYGDYPDLIAFSWTFFGAPGIGNSLIKFDLSQVPKNVEILDANVSFYFNPTSTNQGQAGNNGSYLRKIISNWDENTVTWNSAPPTSGNGEIFLQTSITQNQDYPNIDITEFVKDWYSNPSANYGMMMSLEDKTSLNSMKFCSSDYPDPSKRPALTICYKKIAATRNIINPLSKINLYPNIIGEKINIVLPEGTPETNISIFDEQGKVIFECSTINKDHLELDTRHFTNGFYFIKFVNKNHMLLKKIVKCY